ncbi:MAG: TIGR00304 family membrane protein [Methanomassiliicoccales archaeon]
MGSRLRYLAGAMIAAALVMIGVAAALGQIEFSLFLIIPVLHGQGPLAALSILLLFSGILVLFLSLIPWHEEAPHIREEGNDLTWEYGDGKKRFGGVVLIGPVPIIFGSDWRMALIAIALAIALILIALLFLL